MKTNLSKPDNKGVSKSLLQLLASEVDNQIPKDSFTMDEFLEATGLGRGGARRIIHDKLTNGELKVKFVCRRNHYYRE